MKVEIKQWGRLFDDSTIIHALPHPVAIGDHGRAVCGQSSGRGWSPVPKEKEGIFRCNPCVVELGRLDRDNKLEMNTRRELKLSGLI